MSSSSALMSGASDTAFESMVGDLRRVFIGWLKKSENEMVEKRESLKQDRLDLEEEKETSWKQYLTEKETIEKKILDAKKKSELDIQRDLKQAHLERTEIRDRIQKARDALDHHRESERSRMSLELESLRVEYEAFEDERSKIVDHDATQDSMIEINVGGTIFETSKSTLSQNSYGLLNDILSGRHDIRRDKDGRIFLDRDPDTFRLLLNFLRSPNVLPTPRNDEESYLLAADAKDLGFLFFPFSLVFSIGGFDGDDYLSSLEVLDVSTLSWRRCRDLSTPRAFAGTAVIEPAQRLFVFGGQNHNYKALCHSEIYDCLRDTWMNGAPLLTPRRNCGSAYTGSRIIAVGGFDGTNILSSVESYDTRTKSWIPLPSLSGPRSSPAVTYFNNEIYCIGGTDGNRLKTVEIYDEKANKWRMHPSDLLSIRSASNAGSLVGHITCVGGIDEQDLTLSSLEILDPDIMSWSERKPMQFARVDFACTVVSDTLFVGGGQDAQVLDTTEFYRPELDEWHPGPSLLAPRMGHSFLHLNL